MTHWAQFKLRPLHFATAKPAYPEFPRDGRLLDCAFATGASTGRSRQSVCPGCAPFSNSNRESRVTLERAKGFEPSTPTLARLCSTPELHPHPREFARPEGRDGPRMPKPTPQCNQFAAIRPARSYARRISLTQVRRARDRRYRCRRFRTTPTRASDARHPARPVRIPRPARHPPFHGHPSAALHRRRQPEPARTDRRRTHQEPVPEGQAAVRCFWWSPTRDAAIDLKQIHHRIGARRVSFGSAELLLQHLGVLPGSVTPFAAINDASGAVSVVLDAAMMAHAVLNFHPLVNTMTTSIAAADLVTFLQGHRPRAAHSGGQRCGHRRRPGALKMASKPPFTSQAMLWNPRQTENCARTDVTILEGNGAAPPPAGDLIKDTTTQTLRAGRDRGVQAPAGADRLLGTVVRPLQAADPDPGKGGPRRQGQGQARQDEHRRAPADPGPNGHPVDPRRDRIFRRPAGGRFHGRGSRKPGDRLHRQADQGHAGPRQRRRPAEGSRSGDRRGRFPDRGIDLCGNPSGRLHQHRRARRSCALLRRDRCDGSGQADAGA